MSSNGPSVVTLLPAPLPVLGDVRFIATKRVEIIGARWPVSLQDGEKIAIRSTRLGFIPSDE